jgi:superkiller protein 3
LFHKPNHGFQKTIVTTVELFWGENQKKKDSDYVYEAYSKAIYFLDKNEYERALSYLEIAIKTDILSLKAWAYYQIGLCYEKLELIKEAIEAYKRAIYINPNLTYAYTDLGDCYIYFGLYNYAIEAFKQAIRIEPDNILAHFSLGFLYSTIGDINSALNEYKILKNLDINAANKLFDLIY